MGMVAISPGPSVFPPRQERYQRPPAFNFQADDQNQSAMMLAVLNMLMNKQHDDSSLALQEKLANSQIASEQFSRESASRNEQLAREMRVNARAEQTESGHLATLEARRVNAEKTERERFTSEYLSSQRDYNVGKDLERLADRYGSRGNTIKPDIIQTIRGLPAQVEKDINGSGSNIVRMARATRLQNSFNTLLGAAGTDPEIRAEATAAWRSMEDLVGPYITDPSQFNSYVERGFEDRRAMLGSDIAERKTALRNRIYELEDEPALSEADKHRGVRSAASTAYEGVKIPAWKEPPLLMAPGGLKQVSVDIPAGALNPSAIGQSIKDWGTSAIQTFQGVRSTGDSPGGMSSLPSDFVMRNPFDSLMYGVLSSLSPPKIGADGGPGLSHPETIRPQPNVEFQHVPTTEEINKMSPEQYRAIEEALGFSPM